MGIFSKKQKINNTPLEQRQFFPYVSQSYDHAGVLDGELNLCIDTAVSKISNTISVLPLQLMVHTKHGLVEAWNHPVARLLKDPAVEEGSMAFWKTVLRQMLCCGNSYIYKHYNGNEVVALEIIDPNRVRVKRDSEGNKIFLITMSENLQYTEHEVIHLYYPEEGYGGTKGKSPVDLHRSTVIRNDMIASYIDLFFKSGVNSRILVTLNDKFEPGNPKIEKLVSEFAQYFQQFVLGYENAGRPLITPPGSSISKLEQGSNVQADVFNLYKQSCSEIYRMFNIPPECIDSSESKYNSLEAKQQDFLQCCIKPLCMHIAQLLMKSLLKPHEQGMYEIRWDYDAMLEVDVNSKADYLMKLYHGGLITLNEFRAKMHMSAVENEVEGSTRLVPANLLPWTEDNIKSILAKSKLALKEAELAEVEKVEDKQTNHNPIQDKLD